MGDLTGSQVSQETRSIYGTNGVKIMKVDGSDNTQEVSSNMVLAVNGDCNITAKAKRGDDISTTITIPEFCYYQGCFEEITLKSDSAGELHVYEDEE